MWGGRVMVLKEPHKYAIGWEDNEPGQKMSTKGVLFIGAKDRVLVMNEPCLKTGRILITVVGDGRIFWAHHVWFTEVQSHGEVW